MGPRASFTGTAGVPPALSANGAERSEARTTLSPVLLPLKPSKPATATSCDTPRKQAANGLFATLSAGGTPAVPVNRLSFVILDLLLTLRL